MGLIKALGAAGSGVLGDAWKEAISCPEIGNKTIIANGTKMYQNSPRNTNTKGTEYTISNGSMINVPENVCMLTIDSGKITNVCTEPGTFIFDNSTAPSILAGQIKDSAKEFIRRFTTGGIPGNYQKVIYINLQKLPDIPFGISPPIPYFDPRYNTMVNLKVHGKFEIQIADAEAAVKFYREVATKGMGSSAMTVQELFNGPGAMYKEEYKSAFQDELALISNENTPYDKIRALTSRITTAVNARIEPMWAERGFTLTSITLGTIQIDEKSEKLIAERQKADTMLGADVQRAVMTSAMAESMKSAAANENGSMMGFMGMNMAMNAGGNVLNSMPPAPQQTTAPVPPQNGWRCSCGATNTGAFCSSCGSKKPEAWICSCGAQNTGKFCPNCGKSKGGDAPAAPQSAEWVCSCGQKNKGKFCPNCGNPKPAAPKKYKCDKCGWTPADPEKPPKFCPNCGDPFNEDDVI